MTEYEAMALFLKVIPHNLAMQKWCKQRVSSPELQENIFSYVYAVVCRHFTFWFYFFLWNFFHQLYTWWCSLHKPLHAAINSTAASLSVSLCKSSILLYIVNCFYRGYFSLESVSYWDLEIILRLSTVTTTNLKFSFWTICPERELQIFFEATCQ